MESWWEKGEKVRAVISIKSIIKDAINELRTSTMLGVYKSIKLTKTANHKCDVTIKNRRNELYKQLIIYSKEISQYIDKNNKLVEAYKKNSYHHILDEFTTLTQQISTPTTFDEYHIEKKKFTEIFDKIRKFVDGNAKKAKKSYFLTVALLTAVPGLIYGSLGSLFGYFLGYIVAFILVMFSNSTSYWDQHLDTIKNITALVCGLIILCCCFLNAIMDTDKPLEKHTE